MTEVRRLQSDSRSRSLRNISLYALKYCAQLIGCAFLRWVYPGMMCPTEAFAFFKSTPIMWRSAMPARSTESMTYRRKSVATWSLRERAVCSFLPVSPMRSTSFPSTKEWMSS